MKSYPHLLARVFDAPLFISKPKMEVLLRVLNHELGLGIDIPQIDAAEIKKRERNRPYHVTADRDSADTDSRNPRAPSPGPGRTVGYSLVRPNPRGSVGCGYGSASARNPPRS